MFPEPFGNSVKEEWRICFNWKIKTIVNLMSNHMEIGLHLDYTWRHHCTQQMWSAVQAGPAHIASGPVVSKFVRSKLNYFENIMPFFKETEKNKNKITGITRNIWRQLKQIASKYFLNDQTNLCILCIAIREGRIDTKHLFKCVDVLVGIKTCVCDVCVLLKFARSQKHGFVLPGVTVLKIPKVVCIDFSINPAFCT